MSASRNNTPTFPAPFFLVTLQKQPVFLNDEQGRPIGMVEDQNDQSPVGYKPMTIEEQTVK